MHKPLVGLDLDGVIYNWSKTARWLMREYRGYSEDGPMGIESYDWDYIQDNVDPADWDWLWQVDGGIAAGLFRHGHIVDGAAKGVAALAEVADVILVTHRPKTALRDTIAFLDARFGAAEKYPFQGIHVLTNMEPKTQIQWDLLIDDKPQNVEDAIRAGRMAILFDQPWNMEGVERRFTATEMFRLRRAHGWNDVPRLVTDLDNITHILTLQEMMV